MLIVRPVQPGAARRGTGLSGRADIRAAAAGAGGGRATQTRGRQRPRQRRRRHAAWRTAGRRADSGQAHARATGLRPRRGTSMKLDLSQRAAASSAARR